MNGKSFNGNRKYVTSKLATADVIEKEGVLFYVAHAGTQIYRRMEGDVEVESYKLASSRGVREFIDGSKPSMDGRGYLVVGILNDEGLELARNNPSSINRGEHWQAIEEPLIYDSELALGISIAEQHTTEKDGEVTVYLTDEERQVVDTAIQNILYVMAK